jgi:hypothetical protein
MSKSLPWHEVEKQIKQEAKWLLQSIDTYHEEEKNLPPNTCKNCLLRQLAILIVSGEIEVREIKKDPSLPSFWTAQDDKSLIRIHHGAEWHSQNMEDIENHFLAQDFVVIREPTLQKGRADLGIYKKGELDLLVEVGTISYFKLWFNLTMMHKFIYLIVPNDDILIEFTKHG